MATTSRSRNLSSLEKKTRLAKEETKKLENREDSQFDSAQAHFYF